MRASAPPQDFWLLDLDPGAVMRTFDVTPDGKRIVFDRGSENSDIVLIELEAPT